MYTRTPKLKTPNPAPVNTIAVPPMKDTSWIEYRLGQDFGVLLRAPIGVILSGLVLRAGFRFI